MVTSVPIKVGGAIALGATVIGGSYHIYDLKNPTGKAWLTSNKHTFGKPEFGEDEKIGQGCSKALFRNLEDQKIEASEVYGCFVFKIDGWSSEKQFGDEEDKQALYLKFNAEIAFRKGNEGWSINIKIDNYSQPSLVFDYLLTEYEFKEKKWTPKKTTLYSADFEKWKSENEYTSTSEPSKKISVSSKKLDIWVGKYLNDFENLVTKYPKTTETNPSYTTDGLTRQKQGHFSTANVWFNETGEGSTWLFQWANIGFQGENNFSPVFCRNKNFTSCFANNNNIFSTYNTSTPETKPEGKTEGTWKYEKEKHSTKANDHKPGDTMKEILKKVHDTSGRWVKIEEACDLSARNPDENRKKQIRIYCTNN